MEIIIALFLVAAAVAWYYNSRRDVPADLVKKDQEAVPYKVEAPKAEEMPVGTEAVVVTPDEVVTEEVSPAKKPATKRAPAKKAPAKKTTTAAKKTVKKKTA
jgi:hypothetical protein